ncbi:MAG TPA: hypothetical protein VFH06_04625 [Candidatus Saccharimonadales bacterium]|nr:hypothetical protein [Candidatus Saccharimonadales bacterium]
MKLLKRVLKQRNFLSFALATIVGIIALTLQKPMEAYASTNPGLDSGNAQVTTVGGDTVLLYKTAGTSTFKAPAGVTNVRVLVIAGGGAGGTDNAGGGGAGGFIENSSVAVTPGVATTVTVGAGGTAVPAPGSGKGGNGGNSIFSSLTAIGGGGGGYHGGNNGSNGGSGGGAGGNNIASGGAGTAGQGNNGGGRTLSVTEGRNGGGGGAGTIGANATASAPGGGGAGKTSTITGSTVTYAGGGGGAGRNDTGNTVPGAAGGGGGGGQGAGSNGVASAGTANTGSGGGGGANNPSNSSDPVRSGASGGSGIVIVRFTTQNFPDPMGMTGVRMWYKADGTGNTNALWKDSSGLGYDITQSTGSKQPVLTQGAINFNPAYVFDGTDDAFSMPTHGIIGSDPMTAFYGATASRTDGGYRYFEEFGDDTPSITMNNGKPDLWVRGTSPQDLAYSSVQALVPHVYSFISPNANNQSRVVGVDDNEQSQNVTSGLYATSSGSQSGNTFGSTNGSSGTSWAGPIGEAIYFNRVLTPAERLKVASYLAIKYGVTRYQGTTGAGYSDSAGNTIWSADATFKNNIAGIGRDDTTTLNQKQSKSTSDGDIVTMGQGAISSTNQGNANNFTTDKSFLLWGHNGAATNTTTTVTGGYNRMNRIWKAVRTNTVGQVKVQVPVSAVPGGNGVMYTSNSTTFDGSATRTNMSVNGSNYEATVTLPAGTSYFTFGSLAGSDIQFVSKTAADSGGSPITSYIPGESMQYILTVKNNGPDNAGTVTVTDTLPAGIVPIAGSASGGGWTCNISGQTVTCTRTALNTGVTAPAITIEANIASSVTGAKVNTATASVANDPDLSNNSASLTLPAAPKADLGISKAHSGTPTAGGTLTYNFTVTNNGPSDVSSFTISDTLDANFTYASSSPNICSAAGQVVTCTGSAIPGNGTPASRTTTFSITVNVSPSYPGGALSNTATVAVPAGTTDPNSANNSSTDATNVFVSTDVGITKTHTGNFTAGVNNAFKITVDSQGPSNSPIGTVTVTDTLDDDFTYVSAAGTGWSCSHTTGTVTCTNTAVINAGGPAPDITLTVLVDAIAKGSATNTAEVSTTTPDPDLSDNASTDTPTIDSSADLGITKAHVGTGFTAGSQGQYTLTVVNNGPSVDSPSYTITDTLPASLSYVSTVAGSDATCSAAGQVITCSGGAIGVGQTQTTTINVAVSGSASGTIANTASVAPAAGVTDPVSGNNNSTDNAPVKPNADLSLTKAPATDMTAGTNATYNFTVHNGGPSNVSGFTVTDTLDSNLTYVSSSPNICSVTNTATNGAQTITCTDTTGITNGNDSTFNVTVAVEPTAAPGGTIANTASVVPPADTNDPDLSNNSSSVTRNIVASADLAITKTHTGNFTAGANNTYIITVTNNGPSDAAAFTVTDTLPTGLTFVSGGSTGGINASCTNAGQIITCTGGPAIGSGQTSTITLTVTADPSLAGNSTLNNTASVSSTTPDPDTSNNTSPIDTATVDSKADLEIIKTHTNDFTAGSAEDYQIQVINHGPSDASGFTISDTLPAGLTYVSSSPNICSAAGQVVTCNGSALTGNGASTTVTVTVNTNAGLSAGATINNTATVATIAPTTDPNSANNSSTDTATIVNVTDLSVTKQHTGAFIAGSNATYTMTASNAGPSNTPAGDVSIVDTLPAGLTYVSGSGTGWSCSESSGTVTCDYAPALAVSATTPALTLTVHIAPNVEGDVSNTAMVESILDDSNPPNDTSTDTTTVQSQADLTATKVPTTSPIVAGQSITYRFSVTNNGGPSDARDVKITDNNPDLTYESVSGTDWTCSASGTITTCDYGATLAVGATTDVDVTFKLAEDAPNPFINTAAVTFNGTDPSPANPSDSSPISYSADLEVDISHDKSSYRGGDTVNYTYTIKNHGPSAAQDAVLKSAIASGITVKNVSAISPTGDSLLAKLDSFLFPTASAASNPFTCSLSGQNLTCNASTLYVGTYQLYVSGVINNNFSGQLVTTANISSATPDPNTADTNATDVIQNVLPGLGLPGTGNNLFIWLGGALLILAAAFLFFIRARKNYLAK